MKFLRVLSVHISGRFLCGIEHASAQQIEAGTTVHGALNELQTMDVAFDRSVAPGLLKCGEEGRLVATQMPGEGGQSPGSRCESPVWPRSGIVLPDEATELLRRSCQSCDLRRATVQLIQKRLHLFRLFHYLPGGLARGHARSAWLRNQLFLSLSSSPYSFCSQSRRVWG